MTVSTQGILDAEVKGEDAEMGPVAAAAASHPMGAGVVVLDHLLKVLSWVLFYRSLGYRFQRECQQE